MVGGRPALQGMLSFDNDGGLTISAPGQPSLAANYLDATPRGYSWTAVTAPANGMTTTLWLSGKIDQSGAMRGTGGSADGWALNSLTFTAKPTQACP
jgi:hypothetical protein